MAIDALAAAGFTRLYNILDGMEGSKVEDSESVFDGMRMKNGWRNSGLPWTYRIDPARMLLPARQSRTFVAGNEHDWNSVHIRAGYDTAITVSWRGHPTGER